MSGEYEQLAIKQLLERLAKGKGMPGSGCAAAMSALMGVAILQSVCKVTLSKKENEKSNKLNDILTRLTGTSTPRLTQLMQLDADAVSDMLNSNISDELTSTPIHICEQSIDALEMGLWIFDNTYAPMLGDSATGLTLLDSAARATLFISRENVQHKKEESLSKTLNILEEKYDQLKVIVAKKLKL